MIAYNLANQERFMKEVKSKKKMHDKNKKWNYFRQGHEIEH